VVGDAAIMVDPHSVGEMAQALERVLSSGSLRSELRAKGLTRSKLFSAQKTAQETLRVFEEVMKDR
jgi:glycosyltransferase involved in cell wall biosynthesis